MFQVINNNGDPLELSGGYLHPRPGFDARARHWDYTVVGEWGDRYSGTFSAGPLVKYADDAELHAAILGSLAEDASQLDNLGTGYGLRTVIVRLVDEFGIDDPVAACDIAVSLEELSDWFDRLDDDEQNELRRYADNGED